MEVKTDHKISKYTQLKTLAACLELISVTDQTFTHSGDDESV